ncbi:MAG: exosortase-associated EpsI family protein [Phycisphaerales bacterium]
MSVWRKINRLGPAVAAALLAGIAVYKGFTPVETEGVEEYFADVRETIERIPYRIGPWVGRDGIPSESAQRLLDPNKIMQRDYTDPTTDAQVSLLIVHCGDTRDMEGHWPPNCYPRAGWNLMGSGEPASFTLDGVVYPATEYSFERGTSPLDRRRLDILNFFILPGEASAIVAGMNDVNRASQRRTTAGLGAAQVQILLPAGLSPETRREVIDEFTRAVEPTVRAIAQGVRRD